MEGSTNERKKTIYECISCKEANVHCACAPETITAGVIRRHRQNFIDVTSKKLDGHSKAANKCDCVFIGLNLTLTILSALATVLAAMDHEMISNYAVPAITGAATLISAIVGFIKPGERRNRQMESAKQFSLLKFRMIDCQTEEDYQQIWNDFYAEVLDEPFLKQKYRQREKECLKDMKWPIRQHFLKDIRKNACDSQNPGIVDNIKASSITPTNDNKEMPAEDDAAQEEQNREFDN